MMILCNNRHLNQSSKNLNSCRISHSKTECDMKCKHIQSMHNLTLKPPPTRLIYCRPHNNMILHTNKVMEHITGIHEYSVYAIMILDEHDYCLHLIMIISVAHLFIYFIIQSSIHVRCKV